MALASCYKETISTNPAIKLSFSTDTVLFDTVFTQIGSATRLLKVYNSSKENVQISNIRLAGGSSSPYRINIDGESTNNTTNKFMKAKDSLFIFVKVTVDPTTQNSPLQIPDSIIFETNGNTQNVKLLAWGQDVHLFNSSIVEESTTFTADKPYLIYNYLYVKPNVELTIEAGAQLHFHNKAQLVVSGTLRVNGAPENRVVFQGDRLEKYYRDKAGQWGRIWLTAGSHSSRIEWAEIRNATHGIWVDTVGIAGGTTLTLLNTRVENMSSTALYAQGAVIEAGSCLFANAGQIVVALTLGGTYRFNHCTIANYWGQFTNRKGPSLLLNNYYIYQLTENGPVQAEPRDLKEAYFGNCIIYGTRTDEVEVDDSYKGQLINAEMSYLFENTLLRVDKAVNINDATKFKNIIRENPKFKDPQMLVFELDTLSPAKDIGLRSIGLQYPFDLNNVSRLMDNGPDLGAFEREEVTPAEKLKRKGK